jgi:hypothetical protein
MTPSGYLDALRDRLAADGCEPQIHDWAGQPVLIGRRADFRLRWMATRLHLFVIAATAPEVNADALASFTQSAINYARANKGGLPVGFQTGIAVFPALVGEHVQPEAATWAQAKQINAFGCMARPVAVDTTTGMVNQFRGTGVLGGIYSPHLRRKSALYFPDARESAAG